MYAVDNIHLARSTARSGLVPQVTIMDISTSVAPALNPSDISAPVLAKGASLAEQTYDFVKEAIISLRFAPGSPLLENQLAKHLGISRSPMREALARLEREGFIELVPWRGARVQEISRKYVVELYQVRSSLEGTAARLAIPNLGREELVAFKEATAEIARRIESGDTADFYRHEAEFHDLFVTRCGNDLLQQTLIGMRGHINRVRNYLSLHAIPRHEVISCREHQMVLEALLSGDGDLAESAVRQHLNGVLARIAPFF